jgi:Flp pilus assembly protein TadG
MFRQKRKKVFKKSERGATLPEFAIGGVVFLTAIFGIIEFSRLLLAHNQLTDAVRRGARYASMVSSSNTTQVKNMVIYGTTTAGAAGTEVAWGLSANQVNVTYSTGYDTKNGSVTVTITGYVFNLNIPLIGSSVSLPTYKASATAESAGRVPSDI